VTVPGGSEAMGEAALAVRDRVVALRFPLATVGASDARADTEAIVRQFDDHVLPRLANLDAPALVVVGGSTGSGKSLLVNSVLRAGVSRSGVLRPTTRCPVLVHHPDSATWFAVGGILPGLARVTGTEAEQGEMGREIRLVSSTSLPAGIALLDAPDFDSVDAENRAMATQLLAAADVWVFVTTAARYSDAVPWSFLKQARDRDTPMVLVLNRVPPEAREEVSAHLASLLKENGLGEVSILPVDEQDFEGTRLPEAMVAPLREWLEHLGSDHDARMAAVRRSLRGSLAELLVRGESLANTADDQASLVHSFTASVDENYADAAAAVRAAIAQGSVLRGEVLARWEEFVGTGELLRQLRTGIGRFRDVVAGALTGRPKTAEKLNGTVEGVVESLIRAHSDEAAAKSYAQWMANPMMAPLKERVSAELGRSSASLPLATEKLVRQWQGSLLEVVRTRGAERRMTARVLSLGVNGVSAVLMMLVFSHTGGLSGGEVAVAGGASAAGHAMLEALLGDENLRKMATSAREDLEQRVATLYASEKARFHEELRALGIDADAGKGLREDLSALKKALK
jgi:hypothetical protein